MLGLQFFSAESFMLASGKEDYEPLESLGLCLEPQYFPNSPSYSYLSSTILLPLEVYEEQVVCDFGNVLVIVNKKLISKKNEFYLKKYLPEFRKVLYLQPLTKATAGYPNNN